MRVTGQLTAGNSAEVIAGCISHHRELGVDSFVVLHLYSEDDTLAILEEQARRFDDIELIVADPAEIAAGLIPKTLFEQVHARTHADWILRIDADERWFVREGDIKGLLASLTSRALTVPRFNAVWPDVAAAQRAEAAAVLALDGLPLSLSPSLVSYKQADRLDILPWVLTKVAPKSAVAAHHNLDFSIGGHAPVDGATGVPVGSGHSTDVLIAQLAFSTFERFERKLRALSKFREVAREQGLIRPPGTAWHWQRLTEVHDRGAAAVAAEWALQFMTPAKARALTGHEAIFNGASAFSRLGA